MSHLCFENVGPDLKRNSLAQVTFYILHQSEREEKQLVMSKS
jgi:hypothetical protein